VAIKRTRKQKESPRYNFLYSWAPSQPSVKRESKNGKQAQIPKLPAAKRAEIQAKDEATVRIKKDLKKSLIAISFVLALELVVYLAWKRILS